MANWAVLQEQLIGKQVVKRAQHGIHFDNGDGQVLVNFSGKPCHYEDGGIWKPIDTKLLLGADGFYGCPHSPVKVHRDGRVKVDGSTYTQYTPLLGAPVGLVDNDRIVREFTGGRQYIYVTEAGFRQEIVLDRKPLLKLADARKLLAVEYGSLPLKYVASLLTATDAAGSTYVYDNVTNLVAWLNAAVYPVTIDPDFAGNVTDCYIAGDSSNYATARSTSTVFINNTILAASQSKYLGRFYPARSFLSFNTSSIDDSATVTQVNLKAVVKINGSDTDYDVQIVKYDWSQLASDIANGTYMETAFDGALAGTADDNIWRNTSGISTNTQYASGNLSTAWVSKTGVTYYALRSSRDYAGTEPTGLEEIFLYSQSEATEAYRPLLSVTYTTGGALLRVNMSGNMQALNGGMN